MAYPYLSNTHTPYTYAYTHHHHHHHATCTPPPPTPHPTSAPDTRRSFSFGDLTIHCLHYKFICRNANRGGDPSRPPSHVGSELTPEFSSCSRHLKVPCAA